MRQELILRRSFFGEGHRISTIYFGGGTPSVLSVEDLRVLLETIRENYTMDSALEVCLEVNPDDLNRAYLLGIKSLGVNRLSIGVQSLNDDILQWMNRSHDSKQARAAVQEAAAVGFTDLTIDLIYGVPGLSLEQWGADVAEVLNWPINHLSAYNLTLEERTPYDRFVERKEYLPPDEDLAVGHYELLQSAISDSGWEQYEVSNYAKAGNYSRHNTAYWKGEPYLGIGPAAHSFKKPIRGWNVRSNLGYIQSLSKGKLKHETEQLSLVDQANEYLITQLRTSWGIDLHHFEKTFGVSIDYQKIKTFESKKWLNRDDTIVRPTSLGMLFSDHMCRELFIDHSSHMSS